MADSIVIASAARTPIGGLLGDFSGLAAHQLGAVAIKAAVERAGIPGTAVDEVLFGNCLMAGQGQAPARQAALGAGLPQSTGAVTLSKMCGSGMRAMMFAHDMLKAESADVVVAGGMESMTNAPHLTFVRKGVRYGQAAMINGLAAAKVKVITAAGALTVEWRNDGMIVQTGEAGAVFRGEWLA